MSADSFDGFDYELDSREPCEVERRRYWAVAIGLQEVDGLEVSPYLRELARAYERGGGHPPGHRRSASPLPRR